ncbi:MAG: FHA domain-containing protein [Armatimonadota bacterium]
MKLHLAATVSLLMITAHMAVALPKTLEVQFPQDQTVWMWVEGSENQPFTPPQKEDGGQATLKLDAVNKRFGADAELKTSAAHLCALNTDTGNLAIKPIAIDSNEVVVRNEDFKYINRLTIRVIDSKGYAVSSAVLTISDSTGKSQSMVLTPSHGGHLDVFRMRTGKISLAGNYGDNLSAVIEADISADRADPVPVIKMLLSSGASVLSTKPGEASSPDGASEPASASSKQSEPVHPLNVLLGLAVLAGLGYGVYRVMKNRDASLSGVLKQLGVDPNAEEQIQPLKPIKPEGKAPEGVKVPEGHCPFCGKPKDACDCDKPAQTPVLAPSAASTAKFTASPVLVGVSANVGSVRFTVTEGESILGRDSSCQLAIGDDTTVSRMHLQLIWQAQTLMAKDLGSANGSRVNGQTLTQAELHPGDMLQLGTTILRVEG